MRRALITVTLLALLAACNPDPTTAHPPDGALPPFHATVHTVGPGTPWPLGDSWREGCPVGPDALRLVEVDHWGYDGTVHTGKLVVAADAVDRVVEAFRSLFTARFQIERMEPVDAFDGRDEASMAANNTSAFNCRVVAGTATWSEHAYGTAIDVNPVQNPYVRDGTTDPPAGASWLDRAWETPGMIRDGDAVVAAFAAQGFGWGGHWRSAQDYQHFSLSGR